MKAIDEYIDQVKTLPPAPRALVELLDLLGKEDVNADRIVELVTHDPALTAKILKRCNSAAFGLAMPMHNISEVIVHTGFNEVFRLVAAIVGETTLGDAQPHYGIAAGQLWEHSAVAAMAARVTARARGADENLAFTAALLHDVGKLILGASLEGAYLAVIQATSASGLSFVEVERATLGVEHSEVGGRLLARWNFPENLVQAVWNHHDPAKAGPHRELASHVYIGDAISHFMGHGHGHQAFAIRGRVEALEILKLTGTDLQTLILETDDALKKSHWFKQITE